ncbi:hypothetical protein KRR38_27460 [Novosphingobium sp. G106]|uniref:hypothetical protein n=1 Tax=Novosphingobium sp. G106 TaxID=2849500 RepID=UPI001C2D399E|nr:hypothetical protein [Novosphingobium sp. G106]MBV1691322.1 hypothetical protein [Novosphingobium sp. G106]
MDNDNSNLVADRAQHPTSTADLAEAMEARRSDRAADTKPTSGTPLLPESEVADLRTRWDHIQTGFVDEPRKSVEDADALVASAMQRLAEMFAAERDQLEGAWDRGSNVSTEDLRIALQRYRSFFGRLLAI